MNRTSPVSSEVSIPTRSFGFSSVGPEVGRIVPDVARALRFASVVFPSPGGPENRTCSSGAPRGGVDRDAQVVDDLLLPDIVLERAGPERRTVDLVFERSIRLDDPRFDVVASRLGRPDDLFADGITHGAATVLRWR